VQDAARASDDAGGAASIDAIEARRLFSNLGVVSIPVTSLDDLWPTGPLARRLVGV